MARQLGPALLGMEVEAIYHTAILVYGKEHFFGGGEPIVVFFLHHPLGFLYYTYYTHIMHF